ncbi:hypothetical protein [Robbsia sp. KACC 23696]|uniref:hypothetical protein n=1 Tax=Robbsia sp. KACC 23696 TaxID=3149231 RepID=UPI00325BDBC2
MPRRSRLYPLAWLIGISVVSTVACVAAHAESGDPPGAWRAFSAQGRAFVLPPDGSRKILLMASAGAKGPAISLLDLEGPLCASGRVGRRGQATPFAINGKSIGFVDDCVDGAVVERPESDQDARYLLSIVAAGDAVTVDDGRGGALHYPAADFRPVRQELALRADGF